MSVKPPLPKRPSPKQFSDWLDWHITRSRENPNKLHRLNSGWYFYFMKEGRFSGLFEIRHEYDIDDGHEIGWYCSKYNGYAGDPMKTLGDCLEYLKTKEISLW